MGTIAQLSPDVVDEVDKGATSDGLGDAVGVVDAQAETAASAMTTRATMRCRARGDAVQDL
jgi:hypothetical protein